jgi:Tetratricopeptide repeat
MASKGSRRGLVAQGKLDEALKSYQDRLASAERRAASDRSNTGWQRDIAVLYKSIGDVQRDIAVLYNSIGDVPGAQGKLDEALKSYRDGLAIAERLAASDHSWLPDIAVLYNRIGDLLGAQGKLDEALKSYRDSLAIPRAPVGSAILLSERIGALEEHKRFVLSRETRQRDADRIRRFEEVQRRKCKWIKCGEILVWISELGGSGPNEAARENAYTMVKEGLLARHFEENNRSQVLFLVPGARTRRMTPQRLQDAIDNNYDNQHGRSLVENCWVPQNSFKRWCAWHHLPESPPRFQPSQEIRARVSPDERSDLNTQPSNRGGRPPAVDWEALKDALREEIKIHGFPDPRNPPGWRGTKDAVDFAVQRLGKEAGDVSHRTIEDNVRRILSELKPASAAKPVSR